MDTTQNRAPLRTNTKERLLSLDTLRGFDMAMLLAGCGIIAALAEATGWHWVDVLDNQTHHAQWKGFRFYDLIFPLFMFISGVAIPYAITSKIEKGISNSPAGPDCTGDPVQRSNPERFFKSPHCQCACPNRFWLLFRSTHFPVCP